MKIKELIEENKDKELKDELEKLSKSDNRAAKEINNNIPLGFNALHYACQHSNLKVVETLVAFGGMINQGTADDYPEAKKTPLHFAAQSGDVAIVEFLLKNGANINAVTSVTKYKGGDTPLHYAVKAGLKECVSKLLDNIADTNIRNAKGETAFDLATAQLKQQTRLQKQPSFHEADIKSLQDARAIVELLQQHQPTVEPSSRCPSCTLI